MTNYKIISEKYEWDKVISTFKEKDVYYLYGYFVPFKEYGDGDPKLFFFESKNGKVAYPFMLRDISFSQKLSGKIENETFYDISTVYGYGGPLFEFTNDNNIENLKTCFISAFNEYCISQKIVSQFDRFHPLLKNHTSFEDYSEIIQLRKTIKIDLTCEEEVYNNMERRGRQTVRKAKENGIIIKIEDSTSVIDDFYRLYIDTMISNNAEEYYHFPRSFFESIFSNLPENHMIANAYYNGRIVSSLLNIYCDEFMHSFLTGTDKAYKQLQPSGLLYFESAIWGINNGIKFYNLGGGYTNENDPIYNFKKSFNKNGDTDFFIGKRVHDEDKYIKLVELSGNSASTSSYFPKYRTTE